jgi:hypothetical protein
MALTITNVKNNVSGGFYETIVDITGDSSYATGGEALAAVDVNALMPRLGGGLTATDSDRVQVFISETDVAGRTLSLDKVNDKILFYAAGAEVGAATNLSAVTIRALVRYGKAN